MENISLIISIIIGMATIIGFVLAGHAWILRQETHDKIQDDKITDLRKFAEEKIDAINEENQVVCYALLACLDGLKQLGANGNVTKAYEHMEKHLNNRAHQ